MKSTESSILKLNVSFKKPINFKIVNLSPSYAETFNGYEGLYFITKNSDGVINPSQIIHPFIYIYLIISIHACSSEGDPT